MSFGEWGRIFDNEAWVLIIINHIVNSIQRHRLSYVHVFDSIYTIVVDKLILNAVGLKYIICFGFAIFTGSLKINLKKREKEKNFNIVIILLDFDVF